MSTPSQKLFDDCAQAKFLLHVRSKRLVQFTASTATPHHSHHVLTNEEPPPHDPPLLPTQSSPFPSSQSHSPNIVTWMSATLEAHAGEPRHQRIPHTHSDSHLATTSTNACSVETLPTSIIIIWISANPAEYPPLSHEGPKQQVNPIMETKSAKDADGTVYIVEEDPVDMITHHTGSYT